MFNVCDISYNPRPIKMYIHKIQKKDVSLIKFMELKTYNFIKQNYAIRYTFSLSNVYKISTATVNA